LTPPVRPELVEGQRTEQEEVSTYSDLLGGNPALEEGRSAVGVDGLAGYEAAFIADQEHDRSLNLIHLALALHRDVFMQGN